MAVVRSFPPIAGRGARVLIVGSMPGERSLAAGQYYANPHNAFWSIAGALFGFLPAAPYAERVRRLRAARVAVWDVLRSCERSGSLDADIVAESIRANDFAALFAAHRGIAAVLCNGGTAFDCYRRHVLPGLAGRAAGLPVVRLPSTSPAHAGMRPAAKLQAWRSALAEFVEVP
jgi:hypoxanthine-DNA glycosylase